MIYRAKINSGIVILMLKLSIWGKIFLVSLWLQACTSSPNIIPEPLESQIDPALTFTRVIQAPESYTGKLILVGGEVLKAKGLEEGIQLEILQLPLNEDQRPVNQRISSQGRFLALKKEFLDPATFPQNTQVTIVGEVTGSRLAPLDETEYQYPTITVKHLHVWEANPYETHQSTQPYWNIFGGGRTGGRSGGGVSIGIGF